MLAALLVACEAVDPARFVLVSSFAVYQPFPLGTLSEDTPDGDRDNAYVATKLALEQLVLARTQAGRIRGAVIQPAIVYGPRGGVWTDMVADQLASGDVILPIDELVDSLLRAAVRPGAVGERFIITGPGPLRWTEFYRRFAAEIGAQPPLLLPSSKIREELACTARPAPAARLRAMGQRVWHSGRLRRMLAIGRPAPLPVRIARSLLGGLASALGLDARLRHLPPRPILELFQSTAVATSRKAERLIGYRPQVSFDTGMRQTGAYLRGRRAAGP
jgi:nucleoside-diphosphate-sugar epimerase